MRADSEKLGRESWNTRSWPMLFMVVFHQVQHCWRTKPEPLLEVETRIPLRTQPEPLGHEGISTYYQNADMYGLSYLLW